MCKNGGILIGWDIDKQIAYVTTANCKQWSCSECCERMRERWILRAEIGVRYFLQHDIQVDFVTITSNEQLKSFAQTEYVWRDAWSKLYAALKRKNKALEYFIVPEKHKDGRMHVHALWTANVSKKWLKDNARKRGLGYMVDVDQVKSVQAATGYVTKYVGKDLGTDVPKGFRRVRVSQGWADIPAPVTDMAMLRWEYVLGERDLELIRERCNTRHINMVLLATGELWDYEDTVLIDKIYE